MVSEDPTTEFNCPFCFGQLKTEFIDETLDLASIQLQIALEAWIEMGGDREQFEEYPGIYCDNDDNIVALEWDEKGLNGHLSSKLGELSRLKRLYDLYSLVM